jgi:predicted O-methyltransferase YrrM
MVGEATRLVYKVAGPFDLIFQDGAKEHYEPLLDRLVDLLRPRGMLVSDNVLWQGDVIHGFRDEPAHPPASTTAIIRYSRRLADDPRLETVFLPVGDGVALSVKRDKMVGPQ